MAYLTFTLSDDNQNTCFKFIGANTSSNTTNLISENTSLIYSASSTNCGEDTCSFYSGPSDSTIVAFGERYESCGSIAYDTTSSGFGSYSGSGESCGSIASCNSSAGSSFSGSACSYCC